MNKIKYLKGDKTIWAVIFLLAMASFLPVYSATTNLVYTVGNGTGSTFMLLLKHGFHLSVGMLIVYFVHKIHFERFKKYSIFAIWIIIPALLFTLLQGKTIGGANASRWLTIPFVNFSFQPSTLAFTILMIYVARTLTKINEAPYTFQDSLIKIWIPVGAVLICVLPSNFSTAALMFAMVCMLLFIGQYPLKYLAIILAGGIAFLALFFLLAKAFPEKKAFSRVNTWVSRIENFTTDKPDEDKYQIENAKIAIAVGKINGVGPGKSIQKNFLPQSSSDFIFAIIIEEYGLIGGYLLVFFYMLLFFRFLIRANKTTNMFGKLLIIGLGFPIIIQALINMGVAVELLPVTGQPLPLISSGGTAVWMTCLSLGIILSVTKREDEIAEDLKDFEEREAALQRIIEREVSVMNTEKESISDDEQKVNNMKYSIRESLKQENELDNKDDSLVNGQNPMNAVLNKK